eukprot:scaffold4.g4870.t1
MAAAGAGAKGGDRPPFLAALDEGAPERFYRPSSDPSFPALADATVVAGGRHLPVHDQFLAAVSPVLCQAFAGQAEGRTGTGNKRKRDVAMPFSGFSLQDVCAFLRFAYSPHEATPANLALDSVSRADALAITSQLDSEQQAVLLSMLATGAKRKGAFSWSVPQFSNLQGRTNSLSFFVGGAEWRLRLDPEGNGQGAGTHLSLFLECLSMAALPLKATFTLTVHGTEADQDVSCTESDHAFTADNNGRALGWPKLMTLEQLRDSARGHLQGDALRVSARIQLL